MIWMPRTSRAGRAARASTRGQAAQRKPRFPLSDHCDGFRFFNPSGQGGGHRVLAFLRWTATRHLQLRKPRGMAVPPPAPAVGHGPAHGPMTVTWIGHATVLIKMDGMHLLTDPIWSQRCSPLPFAGPRRRQPPGVAFDDLPRIDAVLISHNHYDHLDWPTVRRLAHRDNPQFFVPLGVGAWFHRRRLHRVFELDWWQWAGLGGASSTGTGAGRASRNARRTGIRASRTGDGLRIHAVPAQHFSGRTPWDANSTLWAGFVVEGDCGRIYFAGDSGYGPHFAEIGRRFGPMRFSAIPIGAYEPRWFMEPVHIDPDQACLAHLDVGSQQSLGIHWGTFKLTDEPMDEPPQLLHERLLARGLDPARFWVLAHGESRAVPEREEAARELNLAAAG